MSRWEFMRQLEELLSDISPSEREEALQYYNDYFNDAGKENEAEVMQSLGTPEQVARTVKEGLGENAGSGVFTETGFQNNTVTAENQIIQRPVSEEQKNKGTTPEEKKQDMPTWAIVLIVIACVIFSPAIFGLAVSAVGIIFSIIATVFSLVIGIGITFIVLYIVAIILLLVGLSCLFSQPLAGIALIGCSCLCAGMGILLMLLTVFLVGKCIPAIFQGIGYIWSKLFGKKGGAK